MQAAIAAISALGPAAYESREWNGEGSVIAGSCFQRGRPCVHSRSLVAQSDNVSTWSCDQISSLS
eukprot:4957747-Pyramimonas_sp.AAC.1